MKGSHELTKITGMTTPFAYFIYISQLTDLIRENISDIIIY